MTSYMFRRGGGATEAKNYALLHVSILAILCPVCDIPDGRSAGHTFMIQNLKGCMHASPIYTIKWYLEYPVLIMVGTER